MSQVPDKTLAWLWSVLQNGYHDSQRTYTSAARTLQSYPTISPRTEVYTHENGSSALLLTLSGTLPVAFRGTTYRYPLKLWIPQSYPQEAPIVYVHPGADMVIRPGQHVGVDGRVYHPYLRDWGRMRDRANVEELLGLLGQVFEREPPVISRSQQQQYQRPIGQPQQQQLSGAPQPPPKQRVDSPAAGGSIPPPRPPKPGEETVGGHQSAPSRDVNRDGPPLPPLPHERQASERYQSPRLQQNGYAAPPRPPSQAVPPQGYQNGRPPGPPLPPTPGQQQQHQYQQRQSQYERSPVSPVSPVAGYSELPETKYSRPAPLPPQSQPPPQNHFQQPQPPSQGPQYAQQPPPQQYQHPQRQAYAQQHPPLPQNYQPQRPPPGPQYHPTAYQTQPQAQAQQQAQPPPDLLTSPFDIALPTAAPPTNAPAPPIPPNPEKEHLLTALAQTLSAQTQQKTTQTLSFLPALRAQQTALQTATRNLEMELRQLDHLNAQIDSNEQILHSSISHCDAVIASASSKPHPPIDDVLVAPTVVGTQLWNAMAEADGCREAMEVLQRGVDRGRIGAGDFVRQMRGLGRERFLRMVMGRKCARGLGLVGAGGGGGSAGNAGGGMGR